MKILKVLEAEEITFHTNRGNQLVLEMGPITKRYIDLGDDTPEYLDSEEEDAEEIDVAIWIRPSSRSLGGSTD